MDQRKLTARTGERFTQLLSHVRDLKVQFWQGFDQSKIELEDLKNAHQQLQAAHILRRGRAHGAAADGLSAAPAPSSRFRGTTPPRDGGRYTNLVRGQFCIQTIAWTEYMDDAGKESFRKIDDAFKGDDDINDLTEVDDTQLLLRGPTAKLLFKVFNSYEKAVDAMQLKKRGDMYSKTELLKHGEDLELPRFNEVAKIPGQHRGKVG
ncbi:hypothetical protein F4680DRAFT_469984 [Xylaria scruposa]|nr:hypothetical protein F4680DRAFT_469984 [Xylaria scruposa]